MTLPLFAYGTLQRGERLNGWLESANARFIREAATLPKWTLLDLGYFPAMIRGGSVAIAGELWLVDEATFTTLDRVEGAYDRVAVTLAGGMAWAWAYVLRGAPAAWHTTTPIDSGNWKLHRAALEAAHGGLR